MRFSSAFDAGHVGESQKGTDKSLLGSVPFSLLVAPAGTGRCPQGQPQFSGARSQQGGASEVRKGLCPRAQMRPAGAVWPPSLSRQGDWASGPASHSW